MAEGVREGDVRHVASLARLGLEPEQIEQLVRELNGILGHMDVLARVDTSGIEPFVPERLDVMPLRSDDGGSGIKGSDSLKQQPFKESDPLIPPLLKPLTSMAPEMRDGFFLVPRLETHEDDA